MGEQTDSLKSIKKLIPPVVAVLLLLVFIKMNSMPPEGQWVKDAASPVLPSLRHSHINEPWTKAFYSEDKQAAKDVAAQPAPGLPVDHNQPHSYFSSARFISARNSYNINNGYTNPNASPAVSVSASPTNTPAVVEEDMLQPGYMKSGQDIYNAEFGTAANNAK